MKNKKTMSEGRVYKCRVEVQCDIFHFLYLTSEQAMREKRRGVILLEYELDQPYCGVGLEVRIYTDWTKMEMLKVLEQIPDSHRISDTLQVDHDYQPRLKHSKPWLW